jgi:hypothetical protein
MYQTPSNHFLERVIKITAQTANKTMIASMMYMFVKIPAWKSAAGRSNKACRKIA